MNKVLNQKNFMYIAMIAFSLIIYIVGLFITQSKISWTVGIAFGLIFSLLKFKLMERTISKSLTLPPAKAKNYMNGQYMLRYALTAIVLIVAALEPTISLVGVFFGLYSMKISAYMHLFVDKRNNNR